MASKQASAKKCNQLLPTELVSPFSPFRSNTALDEPYKVKLSDLLTPKIAQRQVTSHVLYGRTSAKTSKLLEKPVLLTK
jgi:hypothetical protein